MHKNIFNLILLFFLFSACSNNHFEKVIEKYDDGSPKLLQQLKVNNGDTLIQKEIQYYSGGQLKLKGEYYDNRKHGHWVFWYANGNKWSEGYFEKDLRVGKTLVYHENGKLYYKGSYDKGKKSGVWIFHNMEGKQVNKVTFENGMIKAQSKKSKE